MKTSNIKSIALKFVPLAVVVVGLLAIAPIASASNYVSVKSGSFDPSTWTQTATFSDSDPAAATQLANNPTYFNNYIEGAPWYTATVVQNPDGTYTATVTIPYQDLYWNKAWGMGAVAVNVPTSNGTEAISNNHW